MGFSLVLVDAHRVVAGLRSGCRQGIRPALRTRPQELLGHCGLLAALEVREGLHRVRLPGIQDESETLALVSVATVLRLASS